MKSLNKFKEIIPFENRIMNTKSVKIFGLGAKNNNKNNNKRKQFMGPIKRTL